MNNDILTFLKSRNPAVRKQGIQKIASSRDASMLPYLAQIVKNDPDESVRQFARQVGQQMKKPKALSRATTLQTQTVSTVKPAKSLNANIEKQAKQLLDKAVSLRIEGDKESAKELAREAFQMYPDLQHDLHSVELASSVMNAPAKVAIEQLLSTKKTREKKTNYKEPNYEAGIFYPIRRYLLKREVAWRDILFDFAAFLIFGAVPMGIILLIINIAALMNPEIIEVAIQRNEILLDIRRVQGLSGVGVWLRMMLLSLPFMAIFFLIQMFFTHIAAMFIMSGADGGFRGLLHRTFPTMTMMAGFLLVLVFRDMLLLALDLESWKESEWLNWIATIAIFFFLFRFSLKVGENYRFDEAKTAKGCFAIALPYIVTFVILGFIGMVASGTEPVGGYRALRLLRYLF